jgi:hypothetical protein
MTRTYIFAFLLSIPVLTFSANEWFPVGGRAVSMGLTSAASIDFWSVHNNQAGMAFNNQTAGGVYYESRFLIRELGYQCGAFTLPTKFGVFGTSLVYNGDKNMNQWNAGFAFARKFGENFAAGLQLDYLHTYLAENYGEKSTITFEAGILTRLADKLYFGVHIFNPVSARIAKYNDERIPSIINIGMNYSFSDKLNVEVETIKSSYLPLDIRTGAEYEFFKSIYARAGVASNPFRYTFGCGIDIKALTLDFSSSVHQVLGYSPQISLYYRFK